VNKKKKIKRNKGTRYRNALFFCWCCPHTWHSFVSLFGSYGVAGLTVSRNSLNTKTGSFQTCN